MEHYGTPILRGVRLALFAHLLILAVSLVPPSEPSETPSLASCEFPAIFNFGDSNSDTGGFSAAFGQAGPPHGETFFHAPAGRYSDGRLIIDFIAENLGLPYLSAFLDSVGSNFSHGVNFATAASTIRHQNITYYSPFSFNVQFNQFSDFQRRSQEFRKKGDVFKHLLPSAEYFSQALYTFDLGQNDLTAGYFPNMSISQVKASLPDILDQFRTYIKYIYNGGGRYFWIHNTGPLGCLPYVLDRLKLNASLVDQTGCSITLNELAQYFNLGLNESVAQLRGEMPLAAITYVDVYSIKYDLISNANLFGFEHPLQACCGHGGKYNYDANIACGQKGIVNGTEVVIGKPCDNPLTRIIWDGVHYTEGANKWVADRIVNGSYSNPPVPLKSACHIKF